MADKETRVTLEERDRGRMIELLEEISAKLGPSRKPAAKKATAKKKAAKK